MKIPEILFRYRPVYTDKRKSYLEELIQENKIFTVPVNKLNDISEGLNLCTEFAYAGNSIYIDNDLPDPKLLEYIEGYRVLSLCETCFSPVMWGNYANDFNGVCLGFWTDYPEFSCVQKVSYDNDAYENIILDEKTLDNEDEKYKTIHRALHIKGEEWAYEREWRIVDNKLETHIHFSPESLACIIVNEDKIDKGTLKWIKYQCKNTDIPLLNISRCRKPNQLKIVPYGTDKDNKKALYNVDQLIGYLYSRFWK